MSHLNPEWLGWQMAFVWLCAAAILFPLHFYAAGTIALIAAVLTAVRG